MQKEELCEWETRLGRVFFGDEAEQEDEEAAATTNAMSCSLLAA